MSDRASEPDQVHSDGPRAEATVLVVEDDDAVRRLTCRLLKRRGFRVVQAVAGGEALDRIRGASASVDVVLSDIGLPDMDGLTLLDRARQLRPELPGILMSGYPSRDAGPDDGGAADAFLQKPFTAEELTGTIRHVLRKKG